MTRQSTTPSQVREIPWIEQQFLRGLSVHDFEPAPLDSIDEFLERQGFVRCRLPAHLSEPVLRRCRRCGWMMTQYEQVCPNCEKETDE